jgi:hypothetical protein
MLGHVFRSVAIATIALAIATVAAAQTVTNTDIQRLQDLVSQAGRDISQLRSTDRDLASRLDTELDELRDEVVYLRVKLRKEGSVSRFDYTDVRDRLQEVRSRARGESRPFGGVSGGVPGGVTGGTAGGVSGGAQGGVYDEERGTRRSSGQSSIPVGQEIDVRLTNQLSSDNAQVEDRFEATTVVDLYEGDSVLIPAGSILRGVVSSVNRASRTDRKGSLTVSFDQITVRGRSYPMRGTVTQAIESEGMKGEIGRIGAGSAVGAIIGGILGGVKGAVIGVLVGGGGTIAATEGKDVTLPPGTILRVRLDSPPELTMKR